MISAARRPRWRRDVLCPALLLGLLACLAAARAQTGDPEVGILVTATAAQAEDALRQLRAGMDFGVLAKERSLDSTANDGGSMGRIKPEELQPALRDALKGLKPGEFSDVVRMASGYAVLTIFPANRHGQNFDPQAIHALTAPGSVRYGIAVSGNVEEDSVFADYPEKPAGWNRDPKQICALRRASHAWAVDRMQQALAAASGQPEGRFSPLELMQGHAGLAQLHAFVGDMEQSVAEWTKAIEIAEKSVPEAVPPMEESLGAVYLHKAEMENGVYRDSGSEDLFPPLKKGEAFAKTEDSKLAIEHLSKFLKTKPDDLEGKWLLNLAYLSLGEYPAGVPAAELIPEGRFQSKESVGRFQDVAAAAGLNVFSEAGGAIVEDFDNDGLLDVMTSSMDVCEPVHYFHNNGDGTFTERSAQAGLGDELGGLNMVAGDYNNDGCVDVLVLRGGWEFAMRKSLLKNNCDGTFTDVTDASGLGATVTSTQTAAWADVDNDGYLDLFVGNENAPSQLYRNKGDGSFEDISHAAGVDQTGFTKGVAAADYDNDGYTDFYVSNVNGANFLYRNNHDLTFTDVARQAGVQAPYFSFAAWFFDYDNDGWPDLFVTSYFNSVDEPLRSYLGMPFKVETQKLYRNLHNGAFEDVTAQTGMDKVFLTMGSNFGDVDNDGYLDMYLGQGQPSFTGMLPHVLLRNDGGKKFVDITASSGTGELHKGHAVAFADLARSGHEDIVAETGGAVPSDKHTMRVFRNPGNDNDWINVKLVGVKSNRAAMGAEIKVTVENDGGAQRTIYRRVGETSSFGGNPLEQHIGLGHGARIVSLDVRWPATNTRQHFTRVEKNEYISIREFANEYTKLDRPAYRLGGGKEAAAAK